MIFPHLSKKEVINSFVHSNLFVSTFLYHHHPEEEEEADDNDNDRNTNTININNGDFSFRKFGIHL
jgi:hypothetical protein